MKKIKVNLGKRSYPILIGWGILSKLKGLLKGLNPGQVAAVVTNPRIHRLYGSLLKKVLKEAGFQVHFMLVADSEESKSTGQALKLIARFAALDRGKGVFALALGGGVIGDLTGFCASVYRRGIPYIQLPTTLLAQVDSSIGGKVALDLPSGKNLIGSFYQPRLVLSDLRFLRSLPLPQIRQALAEIIKYAVIAGEGFFSFLEKNIERILHLRPKELQYVIEVCSRIKVRFVQQDELDRKGKRMLLNLGHTTGHALEAAAGFSPEYAHGYAVGLGMLVAGEIARQLKIASLQDLGRIERLIAAAGLPTRIRNLPLAPILAAQQQDKKFTGGKNRFVLPVRIGKVIIKEEIPPKIILRAIESRMA